MNITRRTKTLIVPYSDVLNNLNMLFDGQVTIHKKYLPIDCAVLSVQYDQRTHAFVFEIYNKEFDTVEHGRESPIMNDELQVQAFTLSKVK